jgi:hypothetical protein
MEGSPTGQLWYFLESENIMFRVYPILSMYELKGCQKHWHSLSSVKCDSLVPFLGIVMEPYTAEIFQLQKRLQLEALAGEKAMFLIKLFIKMAQVLHDVHNATRESLLGRLELSTFCYVAGDPLGIKILLTPNLFKRHDVQVSNIPPEILNGEGWDVSCDVWVLGEIIQSICLVNSDLNLPENAVYLKMVQFVVSLATAQPEERANLTTIVQIMHNAVER